MMTLAEIRDDALETLNNYGERFKVEVAKLYPDDPDDDMGEMTITAMSRDGKRVLFRDTCFVRPVERMYEDWEFDFTDADNWTDSGALWEVLAHMILDAIEKASEQP